MSAEKLIERLRAATMRTDWNNLPDDACIPAVPMLRDAAEALSASQEEITRLRKALEEAQAWREMAEAGLELADYASYAEIVGAIRQAEWDRLVAEDEASRALLPTHPSRKEMGE